MNEIYSRKITPSSPLKDRLEGDGAALAVGLNHDASHVSLVYPDFGANGEPRQIRQLHFLADKIESPPFSLDPKERGNFFYAEAGCVDEDNLVGFIGYLMAVARNDVELRYGVDWDDYQKLFEGDGTYIMPENAYGLTCASFLAEVFYGYSMKLFHMPTWPKDHPDDKVWRDALCKSRLEALEQRGQGRLSREQIQEIQDTTPLVRLRPNQAAAAIASSPPPSPLIRQDPDAPKKPEGWTHEQTQKLAEELMLNFSEAVDAQAKAEAKEKAEADARAKADADAKAKAKADAKAKKQAS
nr:hypothetical protein [uncultured Duganella sp.]